MGNMCYSRADTLYSIVSFTVHMKSAYNKFEDLALLLRLRHCLIRSLWMFATSTKPVCVILQNQFHTILLAGIQTEFHKYASTPEAHPGYARVVRIVNIVVI